MSLVRSVRNLVGVCFFGLGIVTGAEGESGPQLYIESYVVPPTFLQSGWSEDASADPFAPDSSRQTSTARKILENVGISFPEGASATYYPENSHLVVINTDEQLELVDILMGVDDYGGITSSILIIVEYIEVEDSLYHDWMFENRLTDPGHTLRRKVQDWVRSGKATVVETATVTARSGQRAKVESVSEMIYPGEPGVPEIPNELHLEGRDSESPVVPSISSSFQTRNLGTTLEVDPILGADGFLMDMNLSPEIVSLNGYTHWPPEELGDPFYIKSMPLFHSMKIYTQVSANSGHAVLLGTSRPEKAAVVSRKKPLILQFVRGDLMRLEMKPRKKVRKEYIP